MKNKLLFSESSQTTSSIVQCLPAIKVNVFCPLLLKLHFFSLKKLFLQKSTRCEWSDDIALTKRNFQNSKAKNDEWKPDLKKSNFWKTFAIFFIFKCVQKTNTIIIKKAIQKNTYMKKNLNNKVLILLCALCKQ